MDRFGAPTGTSSVPEKIPVAETEKSSCDSDQILLVVTGSIDNETLKPPRKINTALEDDSAAEPWVVSEGMAELAHICASQNKIVQLPQGSKVGNQMQLAAEVSRLCLQRCNLDRKVVIIAPTVPIVGQHYAVAKTLPALKCNYILRNAEVEMWGHDQWHEQVMRTDVLIITPQLFLDALDQRLVHPTSFCAVIVDECQHCSGRHPLAKIFSDHISRLTSREEVRILGISGRLVKPKVSGRAEQEQIIRKMEKLMNASLLNWNSDATAGGCSGDSKCTEVNESP